MGKYTWPTILIALGSILLIYGWQKEDPGGLGINEKVGSMYLGGILLAIGGIMAVVRGQSK